MNNDYLHQRWLAKINGAKPEATKKAEKKAKGDFFSLMIANAPKVCQNCSKPLAGTIAINPAAIVAHICKKSKVKSIAEDPLNIVYLCGECHDEMDLGGEIKVKKMKIFPLLVSRVAKLFDRVPQTERRYIPEYLLPTTPK